MSSPSSSSPTLTGPNGYVQVREEFINRNNTNNANDDNSNSLFVRNVDHRPYYPSLKVDPSDEATVVEAARVIFSCYNNNRADAAAGSDNSDDEKKVDETNAKVTVITGGLTNALFKVDLPSLPSSNAADATTTTTTTTSVLVRIFGAEGLIDRDEETAYFARLCNNNNNTSSSTSKILHDQLDLLGRFENGRVESWIPNMRQAHHVRDFEKEGLALEVARQLARLHYGFDCCADQQEQEQEQEKRPTLWNVISSWIEELSQHLANGKFRDDPALMELFSRASVHSQHINNNNNNNDVAMSKDEIKQSLLDQLAWLKNRVETQFPNAPILFCHNDVNAANVLLNTSIDGNNNSNNDADDNSLYDKHSVCIIDLEYGSINYAMYDVANYLCEHCGGNDNGIPNYNLLPSSERLTKFLEEYVRERDDILSTKGEEEDAEEEVGGGATSSSASPQAATVSDLQAQVEAFQMASNLYWGIWGILQAAGEVVDGDDGGGTPFCKEDALERLMGVADLDSWDNLRYGKNRLERFRVCKEEVLRGML